MLLWFAYGMDLKLDCENGSKQDLLFLVMKMSVIISVLTAGIWARYIFRAPGTRKVWAQGATISSLTAGILLLYALIVLVRRNLWNASQGISDYAQFLPVVGRVNGQFFSEFKWVIFVAEVVPAMSLLSGILWVVVARTKLGRESCATVGAALNK